MMWLIFNLISFYQRLKARAAVLAWMMIANRNKRKVMYINKDVAAVIGRYVWSSKHDDVWR